PSTITRPPFQFASSLPVFDSATNCRSNPIAHRVRRKRQRLPPSLLIENASDRDSARPQSLPEAFPIKASDEPSRSADQRQRAPQEYNDAHGWPSPLAPDSDPTKSSHRSELAAWA